MLAASPGEVVLLLRGVPASVTPAERKTSREHLDSIETEKNLKMKKELPDWFCELVASPDRIAAVCLLGQKFVRAQPHERAAIRAGWSFEVSWPYPDESRLGCRTGESFVPLDRIVGSIVLDSLNNVFGSRDHLISLCVDYWSCDLAGLSPSGVFRTVGEALPNAHENILRSFLGRGSSSRRLEDFYFRQVINNDGEIEIHPMAGDGENLKEPGRMLS